MGSFAVTSGTILVRACPEVEKIVEELRELAKGMEEREVHCEPADAKKHGDHALCVEVCISGYASAMHSTEIDDKIKELGPYAITGARFHSEWEGSCSCLYVGNEEQVTQAESADALEHIRESALKLKGDDIYNALRCVLDALSREEEGSGHKQPQKESADEATCPECTSRLEHFPEQDGACDWHCPHCGWSQHQPSQHS